MTSIQSDRFACLIGSVCGNNSRWYVDGDSDVMCTSRVGSHVVPILMGVYVVLSNVLLLNLVIAKFK